jgi:hypothetical protein
MIEQFYNETFTQLRRATPTFTGPDTIATITSFLGLYRDVSDVSKLFVESNFGKEGDVVCDDAQSVKINDELVGSIHGRLNVLGVSDYTDLEDDTDSHLDIRVVKK